MDENKSHFADRGEEFDDVVPVYANNVRFEMSAWDLRMFFGQLMPGGAPEIDWHTDIAIPWALAKLMHLYLGINIMLYERQNGKIAVPKNVMPAPVVNPPDGIDTSNPEAFETFQRVQQQLKEFRDAEEGT